MFKFQKTPLLVFCVIFSGCGLGSLTCAGAGCSGLLLKEIKNINPDECLVQEIIAVGEKILKLEKKYASPSFLELPVSFRQGFFESPESYFKSVRCDQSDEVGYVSVIYSKASGDAFAGLQMNTVNGEWEWSLGLE